MSRLRIVVAHGYLANPQMHWFPWLREHYARTLGDDVVRVPALPNSTDPELEPWVSTLAEAIGEVDDDTILIGHSLGSITTLRVLDRMPRPWSLRGLILVAGFAEPLPNLPKLDPFTAEPVDFEAIIAGARQRHVVGSDNDTTVAPPITARLAQHLAAPLTIIPDGGHFVQRQGCRSIPELLPIIDGMLDG
ncbi:hypothetical protein SAMN04489806_0911 [Paramicrobacterium humi]|uniref:Alpha/beta hydrolase family protein n=1 Tax=Paramicrobacterium humi TaxID=640635 RepID=A0A1H4JY47_9MICO|nr:alpha/beta fold hydrolase [Microbacterium humi]SEB50936.1 hypothetical protein SAMN04489806_0911 [Microbacterium humi]